MAATAVLQHRLARPALYGTVVALAGFWAMGQLTKAGGPFIKGEEITLTPVGRMIVERPVEPIRPQPPKPEVKQPDRPKLTVPTDAEPQQRTPVPMPTLDIVDGIGPVIPQSGGDQLPRDSVLQPSVMIQPQYPRAAARDGITGYVVLEVVVNPNGTVKSARAIKAQPAGVFEAAAVQAMLKWKFRPMVVDGKAVEARGTQQMDFKLDEDH